MADTYAVLSIVDKTAGLHFCSMINQGAAC
jgi:hypothetical protein